MKAHHVREHKRREGELKREAREAREGALHYNGTRVGCAVLAHNELTGLYDVFVGANAKMDESQEQKICAEQVAIMAARARKYGTIVAVYVVGTNQPDGASGIACPALPPCKGCRSFFTKARGIMRDTIVVALHPTDFAITNRFSIDTLIAMFSNGDHP